MILYRYDFPERFSALPGAAALSPGHSPVGSGGSAAVWTTCMLFFQLLLLAGYVYSHAYVRLRVRHGANIQYRASSSFAAATLPLAASTAWKPEGGEEPDMAEYWAPRDQRRAAVFRALHHRPLVQAWYARSHEGAAPYRLFALSNLGSMLGARFLSPLPSSSC